MQNHRIIQKTQSETLICTSTKTYFVSTKTYFVEVQINVFANPCAVNSHIETAETDTDSQLLLPDPSVILLLLSDPSVVLLLCYNTSTVLGR